MNKNIGKIDRYARIAVGALLIIWALTGGPIWAWIGVVPLATALMGYCPAYSLIGMNTGKKDA